MAGSLRMWAWAAMLGLAVALGGCGEGSGGGGSSQAGSSGGSGGAGDPGGGALTVGVIPKGTTHEFWKAIEAGANEAGEELGVTIRWDGPMNEGDLQQQISIVDGMVAMGVDGIVLAPTDAQALVRPVRRAVGAGVPVVVIDSGLQGEAHASFVATDNHKGGRMAGEHLAEQIGGEGGKVLLLKYQEGSASTLNREAGFREAAAGAGLEVVAEQFAGDTSEKAPQTAANMLATRVTGGEAGFDGVFSSNESTTRGMLNALRDAGVAGEVAFVGFDTAEDLVEAMRAGDIDALVAQNPRRMGRLGVETLVAHLEGEAVESRIDTGVELITAERLGEPAVKRLLGIE